jgi:mono/diheme cytochrome c family protein
MGRGAKAGLAVLLAVLAALGAGAWLLRRGYSALDKPSAAEEAVARRLRHLATPREARAQANPVPLSPAVLAEARSHFADHCATCHANDGSGETPIGRGLYPKAPDMRRAETQGMSDGELFYVIANGVRFTGMPGWGRGPDQDKETWALVHFIRHLPRLTAEEAMEMKGLNPRTPQEMEEERAEEAFLRGEDPSPAPEGDGHHH